MSIESFVQTLVFGLFVGSIYGIAAMGLALVFGVLKMLNIAHGELLMLGGYATFWAFRTFGMDPFVSLAISIPVLFAVGLALDRTVYHRIVRLLGEEKIKNSLLVSFGLTLVIQNLAMWLFTADERTVQVTGPALNLFGIVFPYARLVSLFIALITVLALHYFLHHTYPGKAILGTAEDFEAAELAGINIHRVYMMTFALGASLAAIAGTLVTVIYGISPSIGILWTLKALIVIVLAGTGRILGTFPAGILLGMVEAVSGAFIGTAYREVVGLIIFLLVLILRPQGLFGRS
ncbi:MAG TPA: branched-chain amino acid ABC transporter permease [Anaerolineales bacterium]|jgi:branched-chain amino acid transport system permease protein|nr:branched-chain amino acid ABC transporter permease [Anaerolineales bacterium]